MELMHPFFSKPPIEIVTHLCGDEIVNCDFSKIGNDQ